MSNSNSSPIPERHDERASQASSETTSKGQGAISPLLSPGMSSDSSNRESLIFVVPNSTNSQGGSRSNATSRPYAYPIGDYRNGTPEAQKEVAGEMMVSHLAKIQEEKLWVTGMDDDEGVVLKKSKGIYTCNPAQLAERPGGLFDAVRAMNVKVCALKQLCCKDLNNHDQVAMTSSTRVIQIIIDANANGPNLPFIEAQDGLRIQVLPDYSFLPRCQKHQFAAFVNNPAVLVVWEDDPQKIVARIRKLETDLMAAMWRSSNPDESNEKKEPTTETNELEDDDVESARESKPRRLLLNQPIITALTLALAFTAIGAGYRQVAVEIAVDHKFIRLAFLAVFIPQLWLALVRSPNRFLAVHYANASIIVFFFKL